MSPLRLIALLAFSCLLTSTSALACEPCVSRSGLEKTIEQASMIVYVVNEDASTGNAYTRPELVELTVLRVFKGKLETSSVLVHSWYGECAYGVQMKLGGRAVLLLQEYNDLMTGEFDGTYKLVEDGCSDGQLEVNDQRVRVREKWISLDYFGSSYIDHKWSW